MNVSYRWLKELAPAIEESPQEIADRLASLGAPVEEIVEVGAPLQDIVIARTRSVQRHPNADRLSLCEVDAGGEILQVVCGAPNVEAGAFYPFAPVGSTLPGGVVIRKAKIRGTESQGMICSARELGIGRDHEGVLTLYGDYEPGTKFIDALGLDDARIVVDVTANRADLLSHIGIAREIAPRGVADLRAAEGAELVFGDAAAGPVRITIADPDACPRYIGVYIQGVEVRPSPEWLSARLRAIGARPINNVVDATNYVLHELGQPLHAFDADKLAGGAIIVRRAQTAEHLTTLDGEDRALEDFMLVIADASRANAVAGVMGGLASEVTDATTNVLLECALFEPRQVRKTRTALGLSTDASYRYERGVDHEMMTTAVGRAVHLILETAGGRVVGAADVAGRPIEDRSIDVRPTRVKQVLGVDLTSGQMADLLKPIGFSTTGNSVRVPGHRRYDVRKEIDVIEEIARRYGYDNFPSEMLPFRPSSVPEDAIAKLESRIRTLLVARGFVEARTAPFAAEADGDVALMHPLSATESRLRRALLPALFRRLEYNLNHGVRDVRLFEIGTAFAAGTPLPVETSRVAVIFTGLRAPDHWKSTSEGFDIFDAKGLVEELAGMLGAGRTEANVTEGLVAEGYRAAQGSIEILGGRLHRNYIDAPAWAGEIFGLEAVLPSAAVERARVQYLAIPQHPAIEQDLALLVPEAVAARTIEETIRRSGGFYLVDVVAFDLYRGANIPAGMRSIAYRLRFRAPDRTLTDADADDAVRKILKRLKDEHGVERR